MDSKGHFRRLKDWDYSKGASFFITLALEERRPLLGHVEGGAMVLSPLGEEVLGALEAIPRIHPEITLYGHVVMPDHLHFNCHLAAGLKEPVKLLGRAISGFKAATTRSPQAQCACGSTPATGHALGAPKAEQYQRSPNAQCGGTSARAEQTQRSPGARSGGARPPEAEINQQSPGARSGGARPPGVRIWRLGYHDHLCLSRETIDSTEHYIANNPLKWWLMHCDRTLMRVREPLDSPLLDPTGIFWRGVGNTGLIDPPAPGSNRHLVAMRISRRIPESLLPKVIGDCLEVAKAGGVFLSTFFSPGERRLFDSLAAGGFPMVKLQTREIGWGYRPSGIEPELFAQKQLLILAAMGSPSTPSSRFELLECNRQAAAIARANPGGRAVYAIPAGGGVSYTPV